MNTLPNPFYSFTGPDRRHPITNPEMLKKIDTAYQQVCTQCNTFRTCLMCQDRHLVEARPLLECSVVKASGVVES
jgi:hypothetical protein